jgi:hypothetical protein
MDILIKYNELISSTLLKYSGFFSVKLDAGDIFRVAIDEHNNPLILISEKHFNNAEKNKLKYRFDRLEIKFGIVCNVYDLDSKNQVEDVFTIIKQINGNTRMHDYFLSIADVMIKSLSRNLHIDNLNIELDNLIKLFSSATKVDDNVLLGLWGELFYILNSQDILKSIGAWHLTNNDLFDFTFDDVCIEVKSTTNNSRVHEFSNMQLINYANLNVGIVSIITEKVTFGVSIKELWEEIRSKCFDEEINEKLTKCISNIIKSDIDSICHIKFNYLLAQSTLKEFDSKLIPRIHQESIPKGIIGVKLKLDLDQI